MSAAPDDVIPPRELHHVTFKTNRLEEMTELYEKLTGHRPTFKGETFGAISFDGANHRIALLKLAGRGAFGVSFNAPLGADKVAVSDTVELDLDLSVIKQEER